MSDTRAIVIRMGKDEIASALGSSLLGDRVKVAVWRTLKQDLLPGQIDGLVRRAAEGAGVSRTTGPDGSVDFTFGAQALRAAGVKVVLTAAEKAEAEAAGKAELARRNERLERLRNEQALRDAELREAERKAQERRLAEQRERDDARVSLSRQASW